MPGRTLARREQLCAPRRMAEEHIAGDDDKSTSPAQDAWNLRSVGYVAGAQSRCSEKVGRQERPGQPFRAAGGTPPLGGRGLARKTQVGEEHRADRGQGHQGTE